MFTFTTTLDLDEAKMHVSSFFTQRQGYVLTHHDGNTYSFLRTVKPKPLTAFILLLLWIIPGVLYLIFAWKKQTCTVILKPQKEGTEVTVDAGVNSHGRGRMLVRHLVQFDATLKTLPEAKASFWDIPTMYVCFGIAAAFLLVILLLKWAGVLG